MRDAVVADATALLAAQRQEEEEEAAKGPEVVLALVASGEPVAPTEEAGGVVQAPVGQGEPAAGVSSAPGQPGPTASSGDREDPEPAVSEGSLLARMTQLQAILQGGSSAPQVGSEDVTSPPTAGEGPTPEAPAETVGEGRTLDSAAPEEPLAQGEGSGLAPDVIVIGSPEPGCEAEEATLALGGGSVPPSSSAGAGAEGGALAEPSGPSDVVLAPPLQWTDHATGQALFELDDAEEWEVHHRMGDIGSFFCREVEKMRRVLLDGFGPTYDVSTAFVFASTSFLRRCYGHFCLLSAADDGDQPRQVGLPPREPGDLGGGPGGGGPSPGDRGAAGSA